MNSPFTFIKINNLLQMRLINWYEVGVLGCGANSLPYLDLSKYIRLPENSKEISEEIFINRKKFPQLSGGVASIIPYHINQKHILPYYIFHANKYIPEEIRNNAKTKWDIENYLYEYVCDKIWDLSLVVRNNNKNFWEGKNSKNCRWNISDFPLLKNWVESLTIFQEIGRVIITNNKKNYAVSAHRDDRFYPHNNHFVNFQFNKVRPVFVYDEIKNSKIYIDSRIYMFNEQDIHGVDSEDEEDFTIRIDGKFTTEFCNLIGLNNGIVWDYNSRSAAQVQNVRYYGY